MRGQPHAFRLGAASMCRHIFIHNFRLSFQCICLLYLFDKGVNVYRKQNQNKKTIKNKTLQW